MYLSHKHSFCILSFHIFLKKTNKKRRGIPRHSVDRGLAASPSRDSYYDLLYAYAVSEKHLKVNIKKHLLERML